MFQWRDQNLVAKTKNGDKVALITGVTGQDWAYLSDPAAHDRRAPRSSAMTKPVFSARICKPLTRLAVVLLPG